MKIITTPKALKKEIFRLLRRSQSIGFIPTMGALHRAHLSLIERAKRENKQTVVSVFVNPTQFGPNEDFKKYPRPFSRDAALCRKAGVDILYHPTLKTMYPKGFKTLVKVPELSDILCGKHRPLHFGGVATVVLKLLEQVRPTTLYLGEKDYQQLIILKRMVSDLDLGVRVIGCATGRESDGLAISTRNAYLSTGNRRHAPQLYRTLKEGASLARKRHATVASVLRYMRRKLAACGAGEARTDYVAIVDAETLSKPSRLKGKLRILAAIRIGKTRLIDNIPLTV